MKILYYFYIFILTIIFPSLCSAGVIKQINFEWEYDTTLKDLGGYILYKNGVQLHIVNDPKVLSVDLSVELNPGTTEAFTMKAFDVNKNESALSVPYNLNVPTTVENSNFLPDAMITNSRGTAYNNILLTAVGSTDFDGKIIKYEWDFGDGKNETFISDTPINHSYLTDGEYIITLKITDNSGGINIEKLPITIKNPLHAPQNFKIIFL
jgi:hypothetical protein